jgi:hypothetical protein
LDFSPVSLHNIAGGFDHEVNSYHHRRHLSDLECHLSAALALKEFNIFRAAGERPVFPHTVRCIQARIILPK